LEVQHPNQLVHSTSLTGFYQNCRGLNTKLTNFKCNASSVNYIFIVLSETWLHDNISNSELGLVNYNIFRYDRCISNSNCSRGGGVLIGIRKDLPACLVKVTQLNVEHIFVRFTIDSYTYIVGGVYIPPHSSSLIYESHVSSIEYLINIYPNSKFIICGDYNIPETTWDNDDYGIVYSFSSSARAPCIPESFATSGFFQKNNIYNSNNSVLDLVFCNDKTVTVDMSFDPLVPIDKYHPALCIILPFSPPLPICKRSHKFYNFRKGDYGIIRTFVSSFNWSSTFSQLDLDSAVNALYDALHKSILDHIPQASFKESTYPPWFTKSLKSILFLKKKAHIKFKSSLSVNDYRAFSLLRAKLKHETKKCYRNFIHCKETALRTKPNDFWKFVRSSRANNYIPKEMSYNDFTSSNEQEAANLFSDYFSSVYSTKHVDLDGKKIDISTFDLPNNATFSVEDVFRNLSALENVWSIGPDGISGHFLFELRTIIAYPLWLLFRRSLDEGTFPSMFKFSSVTPIPKSGSLSVVSNYRPISIQSHISKMFEHLVLISIQPTVNSILAEEQHGFRPKRSTTTCNLVFNNYVYDSFQYQTQVDVIYFDFLKAFDSVNHNVLTHILKELGFGEPLLSWIRSFLSNRYQWVKIFDVKSNLFLASSGVPQGSHLSPILFSLFINNLHHVLHHCQFLCFADDIKLYLRISSPNDCTKLQSDLDRFSNWFESLGLSLNLDKCKIMSFARSRSPLMTPYFINNAAVTRAVDCVMDLGLKLSCNLDPSAHIEYMCCKALKTLGLVMRLTKDLRLKSSLKTLFCALVRPILEYGAVVWDPHTADNAKQIERVQRRFLRYASHILKIPCAPHNYTPIANHLCMTSLAERRRIAGIKFLAGLLNNSIDSPVLLSKISFKVSSRPSRSIALFYAPHATTNYMANEPLRRLMSSANADPTFDDLLDY
jgi:hypothetical protein